MTVKKQRKRFIAGARCPTCQAEDKIYLIGEGLEAKRCCSQCDFVERLGDALEEKDGEKNVGSNGDPVGLYEPARDAIQVIKLLDDS